MADNEDNTAPIDSEEVWEDTVDVDELPDGPTTLFVGGFSRFKSINEALDAVATANDRIIVLEAQDGDVVIDTTRFSGVEIIGANPRNTLEAPKVGDDENGLEDADDELLDEEELLRRQRAAKLKKDTTTTNIVVTGKLILQFSAPSDATKLPTGFPEEDEDADGGYGGNATNEDADGDENEGGGGANANEEDEEGDGEAKAVQRPRALTLNGLSFTNGVTAEAQSAAYLDDCAFGTLLFQPNTSSSDNDINVKIHALSTAAFTRCQLYGSNKAAIYCYPHSRAVFVDCDVHGAKPPLTAAQIAERDSKKPRGYVVPPPPAPAVPTEAEVCCSIGVYADNASCTFTNVDVDNVGMGVYAVGPSKGLKVESSRVKQCNLVGVLFDKECNGLLRDVTVTLCGRDCAVLGAGHPTVRDCTFVGDVRLKKNCETTGVTDNVVALNGKLINEDTQFHLKGFTHVEHDPTAPKKKKGGANSP